MKKSSYPHLFCAGILFVASLVAGGPARPVPHTVNQRGVSLQLRQTEYEADYWASVVLIHFMREGDQKIPVAALVKKYPYGKAKEIVMKGWK